MDCALCPVTHWVIYPWYLRGAWARPNLYRGVRNVKYSAQFHFQQTYNFPACPSAHFLSSLMFKVCKDFPDFHINTRCEQGNVVTYVSPAAPSESWLSSLREEVCDLWDDPGPRGKSARGECDADIFAKCHECHDSWLGHFHTKSSLYTKHCTSSTNHLCKAMTLPYSLNSSFMKWLTSKESWMCQSFSPVPSLRCLQPTQVSAFEDVHNKPLLKAGGTFVSRWALFFPHHVLSYLLQRNAGYLDWVLTADSCFWILVLERCESVAPGDGLVARHKKWTESFLWRIIPEVTEKILLKFRVDKAGFWMEKVFTDPVYIIAQNIKLKKTDI